MNVKRQTLDFVFIGRSILSSYDNPQADLYRGLVAELAHHGHRTVFLEQKNPVRQKQRDMLRSPYCEVWTYTNVDRLLEEYTAAIQVADVVLLGNAVVETSRIARWIATEARGTKVYYDADLAHTFQHLDGYCRHPDCLEPEDVPLFDMFLSTTGGSALQRIYNEFGCSSVFPLYESIDPYFYYRTDSPKEYDLGFIGNFKENRDNQLSELLLKPAIRTPNRKFVLAGSAYPADFDWPSNLLYLEYLPETNHVSFYNRQHCTLVLARPDRAAMGCTPSKRLLAAAACGVPIFTDYWEGLENFLEPNREVYLVEDCHSVLEKLYQTSDFERTKLGNLARERILAEHTTRKRTSELLELCQKVM